VKRTPDIITPAAAPTPPALFLERVRRTPTGCAYRRFDLHDRCCASTTWAQVAAEAARWQEGFRREGLQAGDRVAVMLRNRLEWVLFDLASLGLGLVTVPLFVNDRPESFAHIIAETGARLLLIEGLPQWERIGEVHDRLGGLARIVALTSVCQGECDPRLVELDRWLPDTAAGYDAGAMEPDALASIVYTSGTTGTAKGVMLSHANILANAYASVSRVPVYPDDLFLSILPLSHTLERTVGYYLPMMAGACVAHIRSLEQLAEDLPAIRPTIIVAVPRVFERVLRRITGRLAEEPRWKRRLFNLAVAVGWQRFLWRQRRGPWSPRLLFWPLLDRLVARPVRAAFGGRVRVAVSGGAPLSLEVARVFIALGLTILQGYGLTEASPVVCVSSEADNRPETVGPALAGVEVRIAPDGELLVKGDNVMLGYWHDAAAQGAAMDRDGWLRTGDLARVAADGYITITGRNKDIIVLANGEKVPPADLELAIIADPLFEQVLIVGEGRPYLSALVVLNGAEWRRLAERLGVAVHQPPAAEPRVEEALLERISGRIAHFPGYAQVRRVRITAGPWEVDDGLLTPTMKLRRMRLISRFAPEIDSCYAGH
jgi:long-chain acyl-CoA synthetase